MFSFSEAIVVFFGHGYTVYTRFSKVIPVCVWPFIFSSRLSSILLFIFPPTQHITMCLVDGHGLDCGHAYLCENQPQTQIPLEYPQKSYLPAKRRGMSRCSHALNYPDAIPTPPPSLHPQYRNVHGQILLNVEHRLMSKATLPGEYETLTIMQKVEVFEMALTHTAGQDLYKVCGVCGGAGGVAVVAVVVQYRPA